MPTEDDPVKVACGDSLDVMSAIPAESVDLIVTSPPYNVGIEYRSHDDRMPTEAFHVWLRAACRAMYRLIKPNSNIFINICDVGVSNADASGESKIGERGNFHVVPHHTVVVGEMIAAGAQYLHPIFWRKPSNHTSQFGANARFCGTYPYPKNCHVPSEVEYVLHFRKNGLYEKVDRDRKERSRVTRERWLELSSQIWEFNGETVDGHPAPFPRELPMRCIEGWSYWDDLVLDPFGGSGTTGVAAAYRGRRCLLIDKDAKYCAIAKDRTDKALGRGGLLAMLESPTDRDGGL
jgi:DNA modification methylase